MSKKDAGMLCVDFVFLFLDFLKMSDHIHFENDGSSYITLQSALQSIDLPSADLNQGQTSQ